MQQDVAPKDNNQIFLDAINDMHGYRDLIKNLNESNRILATDLNKREHEVVHLENKIQKEKDRFEDLLNLIRKAKTLPDLKNKVADFIIV